jgi:ketosteroid isomerase-like protein
MADIRKITADLFQAMDEEGLGCLSRFVADGFIWWAAGMGEIQDQIVKLDEILQPHIDGPMRMKVHDIIVEGDKAAVEAESFANLKNGAVYNNRYHFKLFFDGGKIREVREYNDTKHGLETWGGVLG